MGGGVAGLRMKNFLRFMPSPVDILNWGGGGGRIK